MSTIIDVRNVNNALYEGVNYLLDEGVAEDSRNGTVLVAPGPVMTVYNRPAERVLFSPKRNANPFFHLMEALWMLSGANDLAWPLQFNKRFAEYSDDGDVIHGAYGYRWRRWFDFDQLVEIIHQLRENPNSRRAVLTMWSPIGDLVPARREDGEPIGGCTSRDVPCNTHVYFDLRRGELNMTVCNRSNDVLWGAYGANVVHFSFLQEYIAAALGAQLGVYRQFSNNYHAYTDTYNKGQLREIAHDAGVMNLYQIYPDMRIIPLVNAERASAWHDRLLMFMDKPLEIPPTDTPDFFSLVAYPMYLAWTLRKNGDVVSALTALQDMPYCDWQIAAIDWIKRREEKQNAA